MKKALAIVLLAVTVGILFTACTNVVGKYKGDLDGTPFIIDLQEGGKGTMTIGSETADITWEKKGLTVKITYDGETKEFAYRLGNLVVNYKGEDVTLKKQK